MTLPPLREWTEQDLLREREPYHFQRKRHRPGEYPRPPQPNTKQPNQKVNLPVWGMSTRDYWYSVFKNYLDRRKAGAEITNLSLGRL